MPTITKVHAREVLDSRGNPTVEVDVETEEFLGRGVAPSGASTGIYEAVELRDGGKRYNGKGVLKAVENVNQLIASALVGMEVTEQKDIDERMIALDGTENKSKLGANATVATSMAVARCAAASEGVEVYDYFGGTELPRAMFNILNGGKHAGGKLSIQEFMILPNAKSFSERLQIACETYHILGKYLVKKYGPSAKNVGDEGGYAPQLTSTEEALDAIMHAIEESGYKSDLALDCAASSFYDEKTEKYNLDGKTTNNSELLDYYISLIKKYPITSIEDPFEENDFGSFADITKTLGSKIQIVGDDLLVTNVKRIKQAIEKKSCNALLLKLNQIGTVTESIAAADMCKKAGWKIVVSHRSGETEDSFIADFAVGINAGQIKTGAPARGERTAKYNQLLRIEEQLMG
ncbi:MAG: phosphopyruvate hydratase [Candidatus Micrarchaeota archaeon]|nr:phosphopyruvate hydratase [Candidatus Micrarchaeota archaeon]